MAFARQPDRPRVAVVDRPADVVVAAHVGDPGAGRRRGRQRRECLAREHDVSRGEHRPDLHHQAVVVRQVADPSGMRARSEVLDQVARAHDRLGLERHGGGSDPGHGVQRLGDRMHLGLVLAGRAHPLPQEGDGVEPQHLDAEVGQPQDGLRELRQHRRVRPVEVPLPLVEGRPDPCVQVGVAGEVTRREVAGRPRAASARRRRAGAGRGRRGSSRGTPGRRPAPAPPTHARGRRG